MCRHAARALALLLAAAGMVGAAPTTPVSRTVLPNGLTVLVRQRQGGRILAARLMVRVGSADEQDLPPGTSYLLAHLLLDDRAHARSKSVAFFADQIGAGLRVQPQHEITDFSIVTLNESLEDAVALLSEVVRDLKPPSPPVLRRLKQDLARRSVTEDDAVSVLVRRTAERLFGGGPGSLPVEPATEQLAAVDVPALQSLFKSHYVAANMVLVVVSGLPVPQVLGAVQEHFRRLTPGSKPPRAPSPAETAVSEEMDLIQRPVPLAAVGVGCRAPGVESRDYPAAAVLNALLGGGKSSRLFLALREQEGVGYELGTWTPPYARNAYLLAYVLTQPTGRTADGTVISLWGRAKTRMLEQIEAVVGGSVSDAEIQRARSYVVGTYELRHQRAAEEAQLLGWWECLGLGHEQDRRFLEQVRKVTKEDVLRVAKECFERKVVTVVLPSWRPQPGSPEPEPPASGRESPEALSPEPPRRGRAGRGETAPTGGAHLQSLGCRAALARTEES